MTNKQVIQAWIKGQRATTGRLSTDGDDLYSYDLKIGERVREKERLDKTKLYIVWNYRVQGKGVFVSQTTSAHVGLALHHMGKSVPFHGKGQVPVIISRFAVATA